MVIPIMNPCYFYNLFYNAIRLILVYKKTNILYSQVQFIYKFSIGDSQIFVYNV